MATTTKKAVKKSAKSPAAKKNTDRATKAKSVNSKASKASVKRTQEKAAKLKDNAKAFADQVVQSGQVLMKTAKQTASNSTKNVTEFVKSHPKGIAGAAVAGLGVVAMVMAQKSHKNPNKTKVLKEKYIEPLAHKTQEWGGQLMDMIKK